jgi:hypothetical protein
MKTRVRKLEKGWWAIDVLAADGWWTAVEQAGKPSRQDAELAAREYLARQAVSS